VAVNPLDHYVVEPPDPKTRTCAWCGEKGAFAFELVKPRKKSGTGQFVISCSDSRHKELAEVGADPRKAKDAA
jgi:hypothetical protein